MDIHGTYVVTRHPPCRRCLKQLLSRQWLSLHRVPKYGIGLVIELVFKPRDFCIRTIKRLGQIAGRKIRQCLSNRNITYFFKCFNQVFSRNRKYCCVYTVIQISNPPATVAGSPSTKNTMFTFRATVTPFGPTSSTNTAGSPGIAKKSPAANLKRLTFKVASFVSCTVQDPSAG